MPANYDLSDLQPLLPFAATDDGAPFPWQADAGGGYVLYLADDKGLWLRVPGERDEAFDFEAITGLHPKELERKKVAGIYIYTLKGGAPLLPFPFTAAQLVELDERTGGVFSERICCGDETRALIAEIAQFSPKSAELARAVVYGELPPEQATTPAPVELPPVPALAVKETPAERGARWLAMFEEEARRAKRGALQRLAEREGVDRSNMGKDIAKARGERDTQRRAGAWTSQLVQDGKRAR